MQGPVKRIKRYLRKRRFEKRVYAHEGGVVHLTHVDLDAVTSNAIHLRKYGPEDTFTIYTAVHRLPEQLQLLAEVAGERDDEKLLSLSDLNFDGEVEEEILEACREVRRNGWTVEWRDHHPWNEHQLRRFGEELNYLRVDRDFAGCEVVQQDLLPDDDVAQRIAEIGRDRDLWINEDPLSEKLSTVIRGREWKDRVSSMLADGEYWSDELQERYDELEERKQRKVRKSVKNARVVEKDSFRVGVTKSVGYNSDTAHELRNEYDTDLEVVVSDRGTYSLRSNHGVCTVIAGQHGGGGHPNASGGNLEFTLLDKLLYRFKGTKHPKVKRVIDTGFDELEAAFPSGTPR